MEETFLALVREHQGIIRKLVGLYAMDEEDRRDLYQEVLYQAWRGFPSFRGDSKFSTWLYRLCLNTLLTAKRKASRIEYRDTLSDTLAAEQAAPVAGENARQLWQAIRALPETDRALISLHLDGYSNAEIAVIMGITANNTGVKLHRIKQELTRKLQSRTPLGR